MSDYVKVAAPSDIVQEGRVSTIALPLGLLWNFEDPRKGGKGAAAFHEVIAISDSQSYDAYKENIRQKIWHCKKWDVGRFKRLFITSANYTISNGDYSENVSFWVHGENWAVTVLLFQRPDVRAPSLLVDF